MKILNFFNRIFSKKNVTFSEIDNSFTSEEWIDFKIYLDIKNEKIKYNLNWYSCYKALTGTCSLELDEPIQEFIGKEGVCGAFNYCKLLAEDFKKEGVLSPIYITKWEDGICTISDGQHRACICQYLNMKVPAYFSVPKSLAFEYYKMQKF